MYLHIYICIYNMYVYLRKQYTYTNYILTKLQVLSSSTNLDII